MKTKQLLGLLLSLPVMILAACGGGSTGGGGTVAGTTVSGVATKGPIRNGHILAFQIFSSHNPDKAHMIDSAPFFTGSTDDKGNYSIPIPAGMSRDGILIKVIDGAYLDEATQLDKHVEIEYPGGMRAAFGNVSGAVRRGENIKMCVTPYTEMAVKSAGTTLDDHSVKSGRDRIELAFDMRGKGIDIIGTQPLDPNVAFPAGSSAAQQAYALALATISQFEKDFGESGKLGAISDDLIAHHISTDGVLDLETHHKIGTATNTYVDDKGGLTNPSLNDSNINPSAPAQITTDPSTPTTVQINTPVTITANVTDKLGAAVPDGTTVKIATTFGTLSSDRAKTLNGNISVTLNSAVSGSGTVTVSAGTKGDPTGSITFVNPNDPATLTLTANPTSGSTSGPVSISATVASGAGGPVPDGTVVNFAVTSGGGAATVASGTATTVGGVATTTLTSSAAGTVVVTVKAGTVVSDISVNFISQPALAIVKIGTSGTLPAGKVIGGITTDVTYPVAGLTIAAADVATSGLGAGSTLTPNPNVAGKVTLGFLNTNGIQTGEFATLTFHVAAGTVPKVTDFGIAAGANIIDANTLLAIPGVTIQVLSISYQ